MFYLMILCCQIHILLICALLMPYRNGWYYIFYSLHMIPLYNGVLLSVISWIKIYNRMLHYDDYHVDNSNFTSFKTKIKIIYIFIVYINLGFIIFWFLIPIIYLNFPKVHNLSYSLGYLHNSLCAIISTILIFFNGYKLMKNVVTNSSELNINDQQKIIVEHFIKKMKKFIFFAIIIGLSIFFMFNVFIWFIIDNYIKYNFYFEFIFAMSVRYFSIELLSWLVTK